VFASAAGAGVSSGSCAAVSPPAPAPRCACLQPDLENKEDLSLFTHFQCTGSGAESDPVILNYPIMDWDSVEWSEEGNEEILI